MFWTGPSSLGRLRSLALLDDWFVPIQLSVHSTHGSSRNEPAASWNPQKASGDLPIARLLIVDVIGRVRRLLQVYLENGPC